MEVIKNCFFYNRNIKRDICVRNTYMFVKGLQKSANIPDD